MTIKVKLTLKTGLYLSYKQLNEFTEDLEIQTIQLLQQYNKGTGKTDIYTQTWTKE